MASEATERRVPCQATREMKMPAGTISWAEHLAAWEVYADRYGERGADGQSAERVAERGGFCYGELMEFLGHMPETWRRAERGGK